MEDSTSIFFLNENKAYVPSIHQGLDDGTLPVYTIVNSYFHKYIGECVNGYSFFIYY